MSRPPRTAARARAARRPVGVDDPEPVRRRRLSFVGPGRLLPVWHTRDRKTRAVFWLLVTLSTLLALMIDAAIIGTLLGNVADSVNTLSLYWGWSRFLHAISPAALIYDPRVLYAFEHRVVSAHAKNLPFAYPPSMLLLIWPLASLPPVVGLLAWLGVGLALYLWACWQRPWGSLTVLPALVAPSTLAALYYGQVSLLVGALIIGGCRLAGRRPILAGVLFGLAAVKPQFGLLIPVALVSARQWRTVIAAATTVGLAAIASGMAFGWATWRRLPSAMTGLSQLMARQTWRDGLSPSVTSGLRLLGAGPVVVNAGQLAASAGAVVAIWICFRRGVSPLGTAALMVGAVLVTPYAWFYDLPMVSYAVLVVVIDRHQSREPFGTAELAVLILSVALPLLIVAGPPGVPWGIMVLPLLFMAILRRIAATTAAPELRPV